MTTEVGLRMQNPEAREIYYHGEIFAASITGSPEDAVKDFYDACLSDLNESLSDIPPPKSGTSVKVREMNFSRNEENDWFSVKVP